MIQQSEQLQDIIDIHELERILEQFCKASKIITIASDFRGNMLTSEKNTTYYTPFCKKMRLTGCPLEAYCKRSDALGSLEAAQRGNHLSTVAIWDLWRLPPQLLLIICIWGLF